MEMSDLAPVPGPGDDLPVWQTAVTAYRFSFSMIRYTAVAGALVATVVALLMVAGLLPLPTTDVKDPAALMETGQAGDVVLLVLSFILTAAFTVFFHRRVMLGADAAPKPRFTGREGRFLLASLLYSASFMVPGMLVLFAMTAAGAGPGMMVAVFLVASLFIFMFVRLALAFPAIAVDAPGSLIDQFKHSLVATRGRFGPLFGIYAVAYLLFLITAVGVAMSLGVVVALVAGAGASTVVVTWASLFVQITLQFTALAMFASIASRAFMAWSGWQPPVDIEV